VDLVFRERVLYTGEYHAQGSAVFNCLCSPLALICGLVRSLAVKQICLRY
jgi:hypothetical protein